MKILSIIAFFFSVPLTLNAQCGDGESRYMDMLNNRNAVGFSDNNAYSAYEICRKYYLYLCMAEKDSYVEDGKRYQRTEQQARVIEDAINEIVDNYNRLNVKKCGNIEKVKAAFSKRITNRKEIVVGFWVFEETNANIGGFADIYFGNDNDFHLSYNNPKHEKSSWRKIDQNTFEVTSQDYDNFRKKWEEPRIQKFVVNPTTCTGTYYFKDYEGNTKTSKWYFKGTAFNKYGLSRAEILKTANCGTNINLSKNEISLDENQSYQKALINFKEENYTEAIKNAEKASLVSATPSPEITSLLMESYLNNGEFENAKASYETLKKVASPTKLSSYVRIRGLIEEEIKEKKQAENNQAYINSSNNLENDNYIEAIKNSKLARSQIGSSNRYITTILMKSYFYNGDFVKAKSSYENLLRATPESQKKSINYKSHMAFGSQIERAIASQKLANEKEVFQQAMNSYDSKDLQHFIKSYPSSSMKRRAEQELRYFEIANELKPAIEQDLVDLENLVEGKPYLVTSRSRITSSTKEKSILIFYGSQYILYIIPDVNIAQKLAKDKVSFYLKERDQDGYVNVKISSSYGSKQAMAFKKSIHFTNVFVGGYGDGLLWQGKQNTVFDYNLYFYYYFNSLQCDVKMKTSFQKDYYNPYIETGKINKTIDFRMVKDQALLAKIKAHNIDNVDGIENVKKEGVSLIFKPSGDIKMIYPQKKITYNYVETVKGKYSLDGTSYKGEYLYFVPTKSTTHYGYLQYDLAYPKANLLPSIADINTSYRMSKSSFNSIYKAFSDSEKESAYFNNPAYSHFYNAIFELVKGEKSTMPIIGTRTKNTTQNQVDKIETNQVNKKNQDDKVFTIVETQPEYPGGKDAFYGWLASNMIYPNEAKTMGVQGKVFVNFVVDTDGSISDVEILKGIGFGCDKEVLRLIQNSPNWTPGTQRGKMVKVRLTLPINFTLN